MKFEQELQFNSVPEWREHYINYEHLKRLVYEIARLAHDVSLADESSVTSAGRSYRLRSLRRPYAVGGSVSGGEGPGWLSSDAEALAPISASEHEPLLRSISFMCQERDEKEVEFLRWLGDERDRVVEFFKQTRIRLQRQMENTLASIPASAGGSVADSLATELEGLFASLVGLEQFADLNAEGFRKGVKKHDKECPASVPPTFMASVREQLLQHRPVVQAAADRVTAAYADLRCGGDVQAAGKQLARTHREKIKFERQTVWGTLASAERAAHGAKAAEQEPADGKRQLLWVTVAVVALLAVRASGVFGESGGPRRDCLAILSMACVLWASEAIPLYVTGMCVPFLIIVLQVLVDPAGQRLSPKKASKAVFASMFSSSIGLALGAFTLAAALSKHLIARKCADAVVSAVGSNPPVFLLAIMMVALIGSAWVTNIAAPALCCVLISPLLRMLPQSSPLARVLVLGIATAGNVGGMLSPISSVHNIIGAHYMGQDGVDPPTWLEWFSVSVPVSLACVLIMWRVLLYTTGVDGNSSRELRQLRSIDVPLTPMRVFVSITAVTTIGLWCANQWVSTSLGGLGVTAFIPLIAFFGTGALDKSDFEQLPWSVVMLAMGGIVLGDAVSSCGLLEHVAQLLAAEIGDVGLWKVLTLFCLITGVIVCFISHTVGGMVLLPLVRSVGLRIGDGSHARLLVMGATLMCSGGMALPVSSFPNMIAIAQQDQLGRPYISPADFLRNGTFATLLCWLVVSTLGYGMMLVAGF